MSKKVIITVAVIAVIAIGGVATWYVVNKNNQEPVNTSTSDSQANNSEQSQTAESPDSINGLLALGANKKCTFSTTSADGSQVLGTVYISANKKMHGEYKSTSTNGEATASNMIITEEVQYVWSPESKKGVKMSLNTTTPETQSDPSTPSQQSQGGLDKDKKLDMSCSDWKLDEAMFVAPSDVDFTDFSSLRDQMPTN